MAPLAALWPRVVRLVVQLRLLYADYPGSSALSVSGMMLGMTASLRLMATIGGCILGIGLSGILYSLPVFHDAGPVLLISCAAVGLGIGLIASAFVHGAESSAERPFVKVTR